MNQLSFLDDGSKPSGRPAEPILRSALIEDNYRLWLRRAWGSGPPIAWIGLNPSTADGQRDDPTMLREIGFSYRWGFGSLTKVNLYPFISANPDAMHRWRASWQTAEELDHSAREAFIRGAHVAADEIAKCDMVMAAWGNGADDDDLAQWLDFIEGSLGRAVEFHCLGTTSSGAPKHPLARGHHHIPADTNPQPWAVPGRYSPCLGTNCPTVDDGH